MNKYITVTQEDIIQGERLHARWCPLALAIQREFKGCDVTVSDLIRISCHGETQFWRYSDSAARFIYEFDNAKTAKPGRFQITSRFQITRI